jgi:hypothetical protein
MIVLSWLLYIAFITYVQYGVVFNSVGSIKTVFESGKFWLNFTLIVVFCAMIDLFTYSYTTLFSKNVAGTLMILVNERKGLNNRVDLPDEIENYLKKYDIYTVDKKENENKSNIKIYNQVSEDFRSIKDELDINDERYFNNNKLKQTNPYVANLVVDELEAQNIKTELSKPKPR